MNTKQILGSEFDDWLQPGCALLPPLTVLSRLSTTRDVDARIEVGMVGGNECFPFVVECKKQSTPQMVRLAMASVRAAVRGNESPMILVPYLAPERIEELQREKISGVDLCGNGIVTVADRLFVLRTGQPNLYRESRPLNNPYAGRSAVVGRALLSQPRWESLNLLAAAVRKGGGILSLPQASKAVSALLEEAVISKRGGVITLIDRLRLIENLGRGWRKPLFEARQALRLRDSRDWALALSSDTELQWAVTGESSVARYTVFAQGGPRRIAVSNLKKALAVVGGANEPVPGFADIEFVQSSEAGFYFQNEVDEAGVQWASRLQTWLELQCGDARQQEAALDLRGQLLGGVESS